MENLKRLDKKLLFNLINELELGTEEHFEMISKIVENVYLTYGENYQTEIIDDEIFLLKPIDGKLTITEVIANRLIRSKNEIIIANNYVNTSLDIEKVFKLSNFFEFVMREDSIIRKLGASKYFGYLENIRKFLESNNISNVVNKAEIKQQVKVIDNLIKEEKNNLKKKRRSNDEEIEVNGQLPIEEIIRISKKKSNSKRIRELIESDSELLSFEKESRENKKRYPFGINIKEQEKKENERKVKESYARDVEYLLNKGYNIYLFFELNKLKNVSEQYIEKINEVITKDDVFKLDFFGLLDVYSNLENRFKGNLKNVQEVEDENYSAFIVLNKILNEIEFGSVNIAKIGEEKFKLFFLENTENSKKEDIKNVYKNNEYINEKIDVKPLKENKQKNGILDFVEDAKYIIKIYKNLENKYQVSRRNEDEEYFIDLIHEILSNNSNWKAHLIPRNNLFDKEYSLKFIRFISTLDLITLPMGRNLLKEVLEKEEIQNILTEVKNCPFMNALIGVSTLDRNSKGTKEITRLENDRNYINEYIKFIEEKYDENLQDKINLYNPVIQKVKESEKPSFTINIKKEKLINKYGDIDDKEKRVICHGIISLIKVLARQENLYPSEEKILDDSIEFDINKKYITYSREEIIKKVKEDLEYIKK